MRSEALRIFQRMMAERREEASLDIRDEDDLEGNYDIGRGAFEGRRNINRIRRDFWDREYDESMEDDGACFREYFVGFAVGFFFSFYALIAVCFCN